MIQFLGSQRRSTGSISALLIAATIVMLSAAPAVACHGIRWWSTGQDLAKLRSGEIVVNATLLDSYKGEERHKTIMGPPYGMIYYVQVKDIKGGAAAEGFDVGSKILVRSHPSTCESYIPYGFTKGTDRILVLKRNPDGIYDLVGGKDRADG